MGRSRRHARTRLYTSKAFRCLPASRLLAADLAGSGLGASTSATELAAKTVPAMGEVIAFPTRLCWSHAHVWARPQHNTEWTGRGREFFSFSQRPEGSEVHMGREDGERHRSLPSGGLLTPHDVEGKFEVLLQDRYSHVFP